LFTVISLLSIPYYTPNENIFVFGIQRNHPVCLSICLVHATNPYQKNDTDETFQCCSVRPEDVPLKVHGLSWSESLFERR